MKKLLFALSLLGIVLSTGAATLPFRSGKILSAELSSAKPDIAHEDPLAFPVGFTQKIYAAVVVKIDPDRGISIHDYSLKVFGRSYPCIALRAGDDGFDAENWLFKPADPNVKYTLLFVLDATRIGRAKEETLVLHAEFPPEESANCEVLFTNRGSGKFTMPHAVPEHGVLKEAQK